MEPNEAHELHEHAEHAAHDQSLKGVAFTMSLLAVLVAVTTVLGHRTHTAAVLNQNEATDQWNLYQAHKIRMDENENLAKLLSVTPVADKEKAEGILRGLETARDKKADELKEDKEKAEALEASVKRDELRADRYDLAEPLLEIAMVVTSITLLTRRRVFWFVGIGFAVLGLASALSVLAL